MEFLNVMTLIVNVGSVFANLYINRIHKPITLVLDNIEINNSYDLLFTVDGKANNEFIISFANYNNQDILIRLEDGYIFLKNNEKDIYEKHQVISQHFKLNANDVSDLNIKFKVDTIEEKTKDYQIYLKFKYNNGLRWKTIKLKKFRS